MGYMEKLKQNADDWSSFELTFLLVVLDKYPEIDKALREDKPKGEIVDMVINIRRLQRV